MCCHCEPEAVSPASSLAARVMGWEASMTHMAR